MGGRFVRLAVFGLTLAVSACGGGSGAPAAGLATAHEHTAPHNGQPVALGEEFAHVELVLDRNAGRLTAYVLDGEAEQPVRVAQPALTLFCPVSPGTADWSLHLMAVPSVLTGERSGDTSEFAASGAELRVIQRLDCRLLRLTVRGEQFHDVRFTATFQ